MDVQTTGDEPDKKDGAFELKFDTRPSIRFSRASTDFDSDFKLW